MFIAEGGVVELPLFLCPTVEQSGCLGIIVFHLAFLAPSCPTLCLAGARGKKSNNVALHNEIVGNMFNNKGTIQLTLACSLHLFFLLI